MVVDSFPWGPRYWFDDPGPGLNKNSEVTEQLFDVYPWTAKYYTRVERLFNHGGTASTWAWDSWPHVPLGIVVLYLVFVFGGRAVMRDRAAYDVRQTWRWWNLGLSLFSTCGMLRTVPHLLMTISRRGFHVSACEAPEMSWGVGVNGLWVMLFIFSKVPELGDTVFIVLGKKKLIFLHWYHHVTVLLFCWHSYATRSSAGLWFVCMNYSVHAVMYMYYFLMTFRHKPLRAVLRRLAPVITMVQLSQMLGGIYVMSHVYQIKNTPDGSCSTADVNMWNGILMYASYFLLFAFFAVERYCPCWDTKRAAPGHKNGSNGAGATKPAPRRSARLARKNKGSKAD